MADGTVAELRGHPGMINPDYEFIGNHEGPAPGTNPDKHR